MTIRVLYSPGEDNGGGDPPKKKEPPKGYKALTPAQRRDWNDMLDNMQKDGVAGSKDLDQSDKGIGTSYIEKYKKDNPNSSVTSDMIPHVQYEQEQLRSGESFAGMSPEQTRVLRKQLNPNYLKGQASDTGTAFNSSMSRSYYPEFKKGEKNYGTDAESYMKDFATLPASDSTLKSGGATKEDPKKESTSDPEKEDIIPKPNYEDQKSRNNFLSAWSKKHGDLQGMGDTVLKVNETPRGGSAPISKIAKNAASEYGIDPALLYTSFMHEGGSGLFKNKDGTDTRHRKPGEYGYQGFYGDKDFPVNGNESFGVPDFAKRFPDLVAGGYLPKEFSSRFRGIKNEGQYSENDFKTVEDGMKAKAALMKQSYDEVDKYAKEKGISLSKNAKDFFALADFNSGANYKKLLKEYNDEGLLKDDKFLKEHPHKDKKIDPKDDIWAHVAPRIKLRNSLVQEKQFEDGDTN